MIADAVVIGGGIIGACSAYELAKNGLNVILIEKRHFGSGASGTSAAMLEHQIDAYRGEPVFSLSHASSKLFPALYNEVKNLTGIDFQYEVCGILQLATTEKDAEFLKKEVDRQLKLGLKTKWLSPESLEKEIPNLQPYFGAALYQEDGQVNGEKFLSAMIQAAEKKGVKTIDQAKSVDLIVEKGQVLGVKTFNETIHASHIILSAGAWCDQILEPLGIQLGVIPVRGQLLVYETPTQPVPFPIYTRKNGYITPKKDGYTLVGSTVEKVGFDETTTDDAMKHLMKIATDLVPNFKNKKIRGITAGLRPGSPDDLPLLGPLAGYENLIIAAGHYRNGVLLSAITGQIVSDLIAQKTLPFNISAFSPNRILHVK